MYMGGERGAVGEGVEHPCWEVSGSWPCTCSGPWHRMSGSQLNLSFCWGSLQRLCTVVPLTERGFSLLQPSLCGWAEVLEICLRPLSLSYQSCVLLLQKLHMKYKKGMKLHLMCSPRGKLS